MPNRSYNFKHNVDYLWAYSAVWPNWAFLKDVSSKISHKSSTFKDNFESVLLFLITIKISYFLSKNCFGYFLEELGYFLLL